MEEPGVQWLVQGSMVVVHALVIRKKLNEGFVLGLASFWGWLRSFAI